MNRTEVKQLFLIINNCYPNFKIDDVKTEIWLSILKDFPFIRAQKNLQEHIKTSSYVPTPADVFKYDYLKMTMELSELKSSKEQAFYEFTFNGGDGEKFDSSFWDKEIATLKKLLPEETSNPFRRDPLIVFRDKEANFQQWVQDGHREEEYDWS